MTVYVFDVDGVLTESKYPIEPEMSKELHKLLKTGATVAFMTGGSYQQVFEQILQYDDFMAFKNLHIMTLSGAEYWYRGTRIWDNELSLEEKGKIYSAIIEVFDGYQPFMQWGDIVEDRYSQITISLLGQDAPWYIKKHYDPVMGKRARYYSELQWLLPQFSVRMGGSTSIDITRDGNDKGSNLIKWCEHTGFKMDEIIYVGDKLTEGGNDYPVLEAGFKTHQVCSLESTMALIRTWLENENI